jgi:hypothetical protein
VEVEAAELRHQAWRVILPPDGASAGHEQDVAVGPLEDRADLLGSIRHDLVGEDLAPVARHEGPQHHRVAVDDLRAARPAPGREKLVSRDHEPHPGATDAGDARCADRREEPHVLGSEHAPLPQHHLSRADVLSDGAHVLAGRHRLPHLHPPVSLATDLGHHDGVGASGHGGARHDADGLARREDSVEGVTGERLPDHSQLDRVIVGCAEGLLASHGVAVHGGARERGDVQLGLDVGGEHPTRALLDADRFRVEGLHALGEEAIHLVDVRALGESSHSNVAHDVFSKRPPGPGTSQPVALIV